MVGLMGSGKSTIGKLLASRLSLSFVDLDEMIVQAQGKSIPQIFEHDGEAIFRALESQALEEALKLKNSVIATGGGAILSEHNREMMKQAGRVIWLDASPEVLAARITGDSNRPLLHDVDPLEKMKALTSERNPLYAEIADLRIDTGLMNTKEAVDKIAAFLSE
ncbi:MAG: shikimate kinase [Zetaproteobacteria bacterium]|nr:MAG: shikimate kinase [Zetaproteobacteria bacterium]